ncbi:copper amine oxidase N-terminal domain-containing protein [Brevibacillus fluminis]|uniref:copper amine oxidase N-terminal domain-containing protein n=1 Tax=Brevibacillus fluminis TaxID=511487 RepID=UPI003F8B48E9
MKRAKQLGSALMMAALLTTSFTTLPQVHAESTIAPPVIQIDPPAPLVNLQINGDALDPQKNYIYQNEKEHYMVPLREAAEKLGYKVEWNQAKKMLEVSKGPRFFMIQIGQDNYNINKMQVKLGDAPILNEGKTYVPLSFFSEVLKENVKVNDRFHLTITGQDAQPDVHVAPIKEGTVTEIVHGKEGYFVTINGFAYGMRLGIYDDTEIVSADGKKLAVTDLKPGMSISATVGAAMTMSIPPQATASKIVVNENAPELLATQGEIAEVTTQKDGSKTVLISNGIGLNDKGFASVLLKLSADTKLINTVDNSEIKADQLKKGQKIVAFYGPMATKSLPPQTQAVKILVDIEPEQTTLPAPK